MLIDSYEDSLGHQLAFSLYHQVAVVPRHELAALFAISWLLLSTISEMDRKVGPRTGRPRTDGRTDGRTGGGLRPPPDPPYIASAFGDTDGEIFGQKNFRPKEISAEKNFGRKIFRPKRFLPKIFRPTILRRKNFWPKKFRPTKFGPKISAISAGSVAPIIYEVSL